MRSHHSKGTSVVALSVLVMGFTACSGQGDNTPAWDEGDFANVEFEVGEAVTGCSSGTSGFDATVGDGKLTIADFGGTVVLSAPGGVLKMNGQTCMSTIAGVSTALKVTGTGSNVVKSIVMSDDAAANSADKVLLDLYAGPFTTVFAGTTGTGLALTLDDDTDGFLIRGTNAVDKVNVTQGGTDNLYFDIGTTTDGKADVKVTHTSVDLIDVKVSLANGADFFTGVDTGFTSWDGAAMADALAIPSGSMTIYGGDGADTITDGDGDDLVYGGGGNDTIKASGLGDDVFYGGGTANELDLLDYGARATPVFLGMDDDTGHLALTGVPTADDTVTIDSVAYKFVAVVAAAGDVKIEATAADTMRNLVAAINGTEDAGVVDEGAGNEYVATATSPHATIIAAQVTGAAEMNVVRKSGTAVIPTVSSLTTTDDFDAATLVAGIKIDAEGDLAFDFTNAAGGTEADVLWGSSAANVLYGGSGADILHGVGGADTIFGGNDADSIWGGAGVTVDVLYGELGDDVFYADSAADGVDSVVGGNGTDTMTFAGRSVTGVTVTVGGTTAEETLAIDIEQVNGSEQADNITCGTAACTVYGGGGADKITGGAGADYLDGQAGGDTVYGGAGNDFVVGGDTASVLYGGDGDDVVSGGAGNDTLYGENGNDQLFGAAGADSLTGGNDVDVLSGGAGIDVMTGGGSTGDVCIMEGVDTPVTGCDIL